RLRRACEAEGETLVAWNVVWFLGEHRVTGHDQARIAFSAHRKWQIDEIDIAYRAPKVGVVAAFAVDDRRVEDQLLRFIDFAGDLRAFRAGEQGQDVGLGVNESWRIRIGGIGRNVADGFVP